MGRVTRDRNSHNISLRKLVGYYANTFVVMVMVMIYDSRIGCAVCSLRLKLMVALMETRRNTSEGNCLQMAYVPRECGGLESRKCNER